MKKTVLLAEDASVEGQPAPWADKIDRLVMLAGITAYYRYRDHPGACASVHAFDYRRRPDNCRDGEGDPAGVRDTLDLGGHYDQSVCLLVDGSVSSDVASIAVASTGRGSRRNSNR